MYLLTSNSLPLRPLAQEENSFNSWYLNYNNDIEIRYFGDDFTRIVNCGF